MTNKHIGSSLDDFLESEGIKDELDAAAIKKVAAWDFVNRLRIMMSIDRYDLEDAGIIGRSDIDQWGFFQRDPFVWMMRADDEKAEKLWELIERRSAKR